MLCSYGFYMGYIFYIDFIAFRSEKKYDKDMVAEYVVIHTTFDIRECRFSVLF